MAAAFLLLPLVGCGPAGAGVVPEGAISLGLFPAIAGVVLLPALCEERPPLRHSSSRLTARTLTGERSVDLDRITGVRLLTSFSVGGTQRTLLVRDAHGVRLGASRPSEAAGSCAGRSRRRRRTPREESPGPG
ncbi:hypothetical protein ACFZAU_20745 [Streptomyces sp. NPDC008238]